MNTIDFKEDRLSADDGDADGDAFFLEQKHLPKYDVSTKLTKQKQTTSKTEVSDKNNTLSLLINRNCIIMTSASEKKAMSRASIVWDQAEKGYLSEAERTAKNLDVEGKGHLTREQAVSLGSQYQTLKEDNKTIKNQLYGLAVLCVLLFIGTVAGTVMAVKNSKDTVVDMKTGVMKVKDGSGGVDIVTVQAQGTTFQTTGSVLMHEETTTDGETFKKVNVGHCVSSEDIASMWVANEKGSDARLVIADTDTVSSIEPVTTGRASWNDDHIVMGGMTFVPNQQCTDSNRRKLHDTPSFDSISIHRALKERVDFLGGRRLIDRVLEDGGSYATNQLINNPNKVNLGTAGNYVILGKTGITGGAGSDVNGDMGVSPITSAAVTGFGLIKQVADGFSTSSVVNGKIYAADYNTEATPAKLTTAIGNMQAAYTDSQSRLASNGAYNNIGGGEIGGLDLGRGVYTFNTPVSITSSMTFTGGPDDVFIIKTSKGLKQAAATKVILAGGAKAENIFWSVAGTVYVGATAHMEGIILVATSATFITGSSLNGRILSQTAVNLQSNAITAA